MSLTNKIEELPIGLLTMSQASIWTRTELWANGVGTEPGNLIPFSLMHHGSTVHRVQIDNETLSTTFYCPGGTHLFSTLI